MSISEQKSMRSVNVNGEGVELAPLREIKLNKDHAKIIRTIKQAESYTVVDLPHLRSYTFLDYGVLVRALKYLESERVIIRRGGEYHLAAFPKGVIIYPNE